MQYIGQTGVSAPGLVDALVHPPPPLEVRLFGTQRLVVYIVPVLVGEWVVRRGRSGDGGSVRLAGVGAGARSVGRVRRSTALGVLAPGCGVGRHRQELLLGDAFSTADVVAPPLGWLSLSTCWLVLSRRWRLGGRRSGRAAYVGFR